MHVNVFTKGHQGDLSCSLVMGKNKPFVFMGNWNQASLIGLNGSILKTTRRRMGLVVVKLSCFQEEMILKKDPIKLEKKNLKKKRIKKRVWRSTGLSTTLNREETSLRFLTCNRHCRQACRQQLGHATTRGPKSDLGVLFERVHVSFLVDSK